MPHRLARQLAVGVTALCCAAGVATVVSADVVDVQPDTTRAGNNVKFGPKAGERPCGTTAAGTVEVRFGGGRHYEAGPLEVRTTPSAEAAAAGITTTNGLVTIPDGWSRDSGPVSGTVSTTVPADAPKGTYHVAVSAGDDRHDAGAPQYVVIVDCGDDVAAPVNHAPTVLVDAADVTVVEGTTITRSGSFTDADGDPLTLTTNSSAGTFVGGTDGTWSWSLPTSDDVAGEMQVTASDGKAVAEDDLAYEARNGAPVLSALTVGGTNCTPSFSGTFTDPGSADTHLGSMAWGEGSPAAFAASPFVTSHAYTSAGRYDVTASVADDDGGSDVRTLGGHTVFNIPGGIRQPINHTGPRSAFKLGSTVPVKIGVTDCAGAAVGTLAPKVTYVKLIGGDAQGPEVEATSTSAPTTGTTMRYDAAGAQYVYNLATRTLGAGEWRISVSDPSFAQPVTASISVRR